MNKNELNIAHKNFIEVLRDAILNETAVMSFTPSTSEVCFAFCKVYLGYTEISFSIADDFICYHCDITQGMFGESGSEHFNAFVNIAKRRLSNQITFTNNQETIDLLEGILNQTFLLVPEDILFSISLTKECTKLAFFVNVDQSVETWEYGIGDDSKFLIARGTAEAITFTKNALLEALNYNKSSSTMVEIHELSEGYMKFKLLRK